MRDTAGSGGEGARGPGDLGFAPTEAERRSNPPLITSYEGIFPGFSFSLQKNYKNIISLQYFLRHLPIQ